MARPKDFTWDEACSLMAASGFSLTKRSGSRRLFTHIESKLKVAMHEPHSRPNLAPYQLDLLIEGLKGTGQIPNE
jgi:HicA-like toxin of HicAB toxin-antitoxin system